ncbi:hypothetical protein GCM10010211_36630 [Streptomyces albospinus]|uniref:DUF397 domain-containing protein n=1 Tax=Streptomyces albospinus TaxID=285515 RepID=A0ABQ2V7W0_9ACTN|nr:DUF397 domain-containing protein [Streptomyces albospinus]GGU67862.1 hypothetical protein GCM10010211_36630 [Streptomyces albospinus]
MNEQLVWFKSSYSGVEAGDCIEVATNPNAILVRDSKDKAGHVLDVTPRAWTAFLRHAASAE